MAQISNPPPNKIVLRGDTGRIEEGIAAAETKPGMNVVMTNAADALKRNTYTPGATPTAAAGATASAGPVKVATELNNVYEGKTVDDAYPAGGNFSLHICKPGDVIQVLVASGQTITKGQTGWAIASGKWNGGAAAPTSVGEYLEASGGALAADTLMRFRVW